MNLYKVTVNRRMTGFSPPVSSFVVIANTIGEAEEIVLEDFKKEENITVTSASLLKNNYHFSDMDYYIENKKNKL